MNRTVTQPNTCPMEYINITQLADGRYQVDAKGRNTALAEQPRFFKNQSEYQDFWQFMKTNLDGFSNCLDPMSANEASDSTTTVPVDVTVPVDATIAVDSSDSSEQSEQSEQSDSSKSSEQTVSPADIDEQKETKPTEFTPEYLDNLFKDVDIDGLPGGFEIPSEFNLASFAAGSIFRAALLFGLIFLFTGVIPAQPIGQTTRLTIAGVVVFIYTFIDVIREIIWRILMASRHLICR